VTPANLSRRFGLEPFLVRAVLIGWDVPIHHAGGVPLVEVERFAWEASLQNGGSVASTKKAAVEGQTRTAACRKVDGRG
jgi:hypothetical protein